MRITAALLVTALLLVGCAETPQRLEGSGDMVLIPALADYCTRYPAECEALQ